MREPLLHEAPLLEGLGVSKRYRTAATRLFAREGGLWGLGNAEGETVDFEVRRGESVAIVGESGSGKSTLLGMLLGLGTPTSGEIRFDGSLVFPRQRRDRMLWLRRRTGIVFQDPYSSFNPRRTIGQTVAEPLIATSAPGNHREAVTAILDRMELPKGSADRYPHEFSGGQRQRIALARALAQMQAKKPFVRAYAIAKRQQTIAVFAVERFLIAIVQAMLMCNKALYLLQLRKAQRRLQIGKAIIIAHFIVQKLQLIGLCLRGKMLDMLCPIGMV